MKGTQDMDSKGQSHAASAAQMAGLVDQVEALRWRAVERMGRRMGVSVFRFDAAGQRDAILDRARPPVTSGPEIPLAPARGAVLGVTVHHMVRGVDGYEPANAGFLGRDPVRGQDAFDVMERQAQRAGGGGLFTSAQVDAARRYAALVERHSSRGIKGLSVEARSDGGRAGGGGYMDAVLAEGRAIQRMREAIGDDLAIAPRRGTKARGAMTLRDLVDAVCLQGLTVGDVLKRRGWAVNASARRRVRERLCQALDRMADAAPGLG